MRRSDLLAGLLLSGVVAGGGEDSSSSSKPLEIYVCSWHAADEERCLEGGDDDGDEDDEGGNDNGGGRWRSPPVGPPGQPPKRYVLRAFGVDADGASVALRIDGFTPFFYVKLPAALMRGPRRSAVIGAAQRHLEERLGASAKPLRKKDFWGFTNGELFDFMRLTFASREHCRWAAARLKHPQRLAAVNLSVSFEVYEANVDPMIRFLHVRQLSPVGWARVAAKDLLVQQRLGDGSNRPTCCSRYAECDWRRVGPASGVDRAAPLVVCGFDLECDSAHGDFPVARKDYRRLAIDLETNAWQPGDSEYDAKRRLIACMRAAFSLPPEASGPSVEAARLHVKRRTARGKEWPPAEGGRELAALETAIKRVVDDAYTALKTTAAQAKAAAGRGPQLPSSSSSASSWTPEKRKMWFGDRSAGPASSPPRVQTQQKEKNDKPHEDDKQEKQQQQQQQQDDEDDADAFSTLGRLTAVLNAAFAARWPLEGDAVIQIGATFGVPGFSASVVQHRHILTLGSCEPIEGATVRSFDDEREMLIAFVDLVRAMDPDIVLGYNIFGFDFAYLYDRARELIGDDVQVLGREFLRLGRIDGLPSEYVEQKLSSSALGDNVLKYLDMHGRVVVDLMKVVQRDHKLDSYKLDAVAEHFTGLRKNDVSPNDVFRLQKGSAADRRIIAEYCIQDCELCNRLAAKLEILANNSGMANVCSVPLPFIFMRGQGVKIFSLVAKRCREDGFLIPTRSKPGLGAGGGGDDDEEEEGYEGAIVLEPQTGMYLDEPVSVLDYNSLYPSSMISHNLSHDTLVVDHARYGALPGVEYVEVSYDRYEGKGDEKKVVGTQVCRYASQRSVGPGVLARILQDLLAQRKATRRRMAELPEGAADTEFKRAVLDGLQVAYKVTANSLYGQMGARTSPLYLKHIAACTTAVGRSMILQAKAYVEGPDVGGKVVYGDSVAPWTPVWIRLGGSKVVLTTAERVEEELVVFRSSWRAMEDPSCEMSDRKESLELVDVEVWSEVGWTRAARLIRHRLAAHKRLFRVACDAGVVDVTGDHSLLLSDGTPVTARELRANQDRLLLAPTLPRASRPTKGADDDERARAHEWEAGGRDDESASCCDAESARVVDQAFDFEGGLTLRSSDQLSAAEAFELIEGAGVVALRDGSYEVGRSCTRIARDAATVRSVTEIPGITYLANLANLANLATPTTAADNSAENSGGTSGGVLGGAPPYVYDFTTASGHFAAGVGRVVVHNTDSIFIVFKNEDAASGRKLVGRDALASSIRQGQSASIGIKPQLAPPHNLEYEKTMFPLLLLSKKRYVGLLYEDNADAKPKQKSMGIALKRRDYAAIVKQVYGGVIDIVLNDRDIPKAVEFLKRRLLDLVEGRYELDDLVISKTLRSYYKFPQQIAHAVLARRMRDRDPGSAPQTNDRVPYVFIETSKKNALMGDRIEHLDYVREHLSGGSSGSGSSKQQQQQQQQRVIVDTKLYIQNQIQKPCLQLLAIALEQLPGYAPRAELSGPEALEVLVRAKSGDRGKARDRLDALREREVERLIFAPLMEHGRVKERDNRCSGQNGIQRYFFSDGGPK